MADEGLMPANHFSDRIGLRGPSVLWGVEGALDALGDGCTSFCMLGLIGVGLVGFVSLSVAVPKEGFGNHRLTTIENAHSDEWGVQPTLWAYPQCRAAPAVQCVGALLIASATKG